MYFMCRLVCITNRFAEGEPGRINRTPHLLTETVMNPVCYPIALKTAADRSLKMGRRLKIILTHCAVMAAFGAVVYCILDSIPPCTTVVLPKHVHIVPAFLLRALGVFFLGYWKHIGRAYEFAALTITTVFIGLPVNILNTVFCVLLYTMIVFFAAVTVIALTNKYLSTRKEVCNGTGTRSERT